MIITKERFTELQKIYNIGDCPDGTSLYLDMQKMFSAAGQEMTEELTVKVFDEYYDMPCTIQDRIAECL